MCYNEICKNLFLHDKQKNYDYECLSLSKRGRASAMKISYNKLWKVLVDKKMSKADLRRATEMASNTMTSLRRDKKVSLDVLLRICEVLDCDIGEIMSVYKEEQNA